MITLRINYKTNSLFFQHHPEKNVKNSLLGLSYVPLNHEDIFSLQTFKEIQEERFANNMDFYVCAVKENNHFFFFEGSRFIEAFLNEGKRIKNPMTRKDIDDFEVLYCNKENTVFYSYKLKKEVEVFPYYLPIMWNDHTRPVEERADYLNRMGECYFIGKGLEKNIDLAIYFCEKAVKLKYPRALYTLSIIFNNRREYRKSTYYLVHFLKMKDAKINTHILLCAADDFDRGGITINSTYRAYYSKRAALLGNFFAIGQLIFSYEEGDGIKQNPHKASLWRTYLPEEWRSRDIIDFLNHLKDSTPNYLSQTQTLSLPKELLEDEPELQPPDPDVLFPEVKEDFDRRVTPENLYHFSLEEIESIKQRSETQISSEGYEADSELTPENKV